MSAISRIDRKARFSTISARREGERARRYGRGMSANPHPIGTLERQSWDTGWRFENNKLTPKS